MCIFKKCAFVLQTWQKTNKQNKMKVSIVNSLGKIMSPVEQRAGLFIAQCNKDNDTLWGKGQTLLPHCTHFGFED